jgi:peroxiredoxin
MIGALFLAAALVAPDFTLPSLQGSPVHLASFRGKVVLVNFWATWCGGCKVEMPWLAELDRRDRSHGLEIIGVSMDDAPNGVVARFVKSKNVRYTIVRGDDAVARSYWSVQQMPQTFVIDREGKIVEHFVGLPEKAELQRTVARLLRR